VAEGTRLYFKQRETAMLIVEDSEKALTNKANIDVRNFLRATASTIIEEYPEFERLWERVLSRELD
jgi:hypothetical protein